MEQEIESLYEKLHTELFKWCCLMTQNDEMAREIIQEGFLRAIDHYSDIEGLEFAQQRAWFYRTIKNIFIDTLRRGKNENLTSDISDEGFDQSVSSFDKYSEKELMCLIESLEVLEGKILILRYVEGFSSGQIGQMLGLPAGTVRSKLHDARKHLKEML
ncbi:MAG: RNA polymerase sigma factor [Butyrivibrio sp.]|nr:RNA polymerase sigma factor [Butyrivibrio sp.]